MVKDEFLSCVFQAKKTHINLYFITRVKKDGVLSRARAVDKYFINVFQIEITEEIRDYLYDISIREFNKIKSKDDLDFIEFDLINDDIQHLFTYKMNNSTNSFSDVVYNKLESMPEKITDLRKILSSQDLWAYCVTFQIDSQLKFHTFRKISPGKVCTEKSYNTIFDTNTKKLTLLVGDTIHLDNKIDCIFIGDTFYVLRKQAFETILGLTEDYKEKAIEIVEEIKNNSCFANSDVLLDRIEKQPSIHKKLIRLKKLNGLDNLNDESIKKLKDLGEKKNNPINIKDGKIYFETDEDIDNTIKLLCDYYKTGDFTGKSYVTFSGILQE